MADAALIFGMLLLIVAVFIWIWWDLDNTRRKAERWIHVERLRQERADEDEAYAWWNADVQARADALIAASQAAGAVDRVNQLLEQPNLTSAA